MVNDEVFAKVKQESSGFRSRILIMEEQAKELEEKVEERGYYEQENIQEFLHRMERIKNLEIENQAIK